MVGIQIGKEQEERKREEEGLNFETTPWWNFITIMGYADEELRSASLLKLRAQPTAKAKRRRHMRGRGPIIREGGGLSYARQRADHT